MFEMVPGTKIASLAAQLEARVGEPVKVKEEMNIRTILADVVGNPSAGFRLDYTSISRVEVTVPGGPNGEGPADPYCSVASTNETAHFDAERTTEVGAFRGAPRPGAPPANRPPMTAPTS